MRTERLTETWYVVASSAAAARRELIAYLEHPRETVEVEYVYTDADKACDHIRYGWMTGNMTVYTVTLDISSGE